MDIRVLFSDGSERGQHNPRRRDTPYDAAAAVKVVNGLRAGAAMPMM